MFGFKVPGGTTGGVQVCVYTGVPPPILALIEPVPPAQLGFVGVNVIVIAEGVATLVVVVLVQPLPSVIVQV